MELDIVSIQGNQDRQIYQATTEEISANPTLQFILDELGAAPLDWMKSLPKSLQLNQDVYLCHGTPESDLVYLLEEVSSGGPVLREESEIIDLINGQHSTVILCGHTHIPRAVTLKTRQLIVNPGSVGLPAYADDLPHYHEMQNYSPHANYAIIELIDHQWKVWQMNVPYAYQKAAAEARLRGRFDWAQALETGRCQ